MLDAVEAHSCIDTDHSEISLNEQYTTIDRYTSMAEHFDPNVFVNCLRIQG